MLRLIQAMITLWIMSVIVFLLAHVSGDPLNLIMPLEATTEDFEAMRRTLGLDRPLYVQYVSWVGDALQGDLGVSLAQRRGVAELIMDRLPNSFMLAAFALSFALFVGIPLGVVAAVKKDRGLDTAAKLAALIGQAIPSFWLGLLLMLVFAVRLRWFPAGGMDHGLRSFILPAISLAGFSLAAVMRLTRSSMLEVLDSDYVKMARIKGASEGRVIVHHTLRNALLPVITFAGFYFSLMVSAAIVVETVFTWPGIGRLAFNAVTHRDFPVIQGVVLTTAVIVIGANLIVDVLYAYIDPRIRY